MKKPALSLIMFAFLCGGFAQAASADASVGVVFTSKEVRIIASWYDEHRHQINDRGAGKGKTKGLPPGIAKNLARGKALPPGIAKQQLPNGLVSVLPPSPRGYERIIVDGRVLLVEIATQVIHDVLTDLIVK
jgi:Ni/Co efflux regulator RcnB